MNSIKYYLDQVKTIFDAEQFDAEPHELYAPIDYTLRLGGKRIRPTMLLIANALFGGDEKQVHNAALGIETFHNFTLLHDDLMDRSPLRRGQPTVYTKWNENTAILSGDTMFALAWRFFLRQPSPSLQEILQCFNETAIEVCEGQQKDMNFERMGLANVSIGDYMDMIRQKTAVLLAGALKIGALYAGAPANEVERLYAVFGKKTGQDIRDNKISFLPLTALKTANEEQKQQLLALFASKDNMDEEEKVRQVLAIYESLNLKNTIEKAIADEFETARKELDGIHADETQKTPLRELMETLIGRKK